MKIYTYTDFTAHQGHLSTIEAEEIYSEILVSAKLIDSEFKEFWEDFVKASVTYAEIRGKWLTLSREEKMDIDPSRTAIHNNVILTIKIISRYMEQQGWNNQWFYKLSSNEVHERKRIGDFACYVAYLHAVNAR